MARGLKGNRKPGRGYKVALGILAGLLLLLGAALGIAALNANTVHVRRATVAVPDLPAAFEGRTILYASDFDLCGLNTAEKSAALLNDLQALAPDMLVLGGDYASESVFDALNRGDFDGDGAAKRLRARTDFFHYISGFSAPLGRFAVAAPEDGDRAELAALMEACGFTPLIDARADVRLNGEALTLVGLCGDGADLTPLIGGIRRGDCAVAVAWSPNAFPAVVTGEAADGGPWADLLLTGHTHGGQVRLFGRSMLPLERLEAQVDSGWSVQNGLPVLVTSGVGCEGANLRLGTQAEVWLITLARAA